MGRSEGILSLGGVGGLSPGEHVGAGHVRGREAPDGAAPVQTGARVGRGPFQGSSPCSPGRLSPWFP